MTKKSLPGGESKATQHRLLTWVGLGVIVIVIAVAIGGWRHRSQPSDVSVGQDNATSKRVSQYVGSERCVSCHATEATEWRQSQHHAAMAHADTKSVLGNFNDATFSYAGITSTFFKRDGKFFARTDGPDGKLTDFEIKYTFGVYPLQQYLVEFTDGRVQPLPIAWDTRSKSEHGQRWFHLYPNEKITHNDELHWTRPAQNWNFMCADCHSTDLQKNYDITTNRFQTKWAEISVGCEACHGPGADHLTWAATHKKGEAVAKDDNEGLSTDFGERRGVSWTHDAATGNPVRSRPRSEENEIEVCAQCHSRRSQIADGYTAGKPYLDYYRPALLTPPLYYPDGQQHGEVYKWGSFVQSKMYAAGVTCSDCHNPHTGKVRAEGNTLCTGCHLPAKYDTTQHHHHPVGSAGAQCVACHMPTTNYMVIDPRHDHSLRVPRPDQSVSLGVPNACNNCHTKQDARWAAAQVKTWYGHDPQGYQQFAQTFAAASVGAPGAQAHLRTIAGDSAQPPLVRATAFSQINAVFQQATLEALAAGSQDPNALVRLGVLQSLANAPLNVRGPLASPLLSDPVRAVRIDAASVLAPVPEAQLSAEARAAFKQAADEYITSQRYNADRADARVNLGTFYANRGDMGNAELQLKSAMRLEPSYVPAYVNLADIYRANNRDAEGETILREGLKRMPDSAVLHYALGLTLVRMQQMQAALAELQRADALEPDNTRYTYIYAVALNSTGKTEEAIAKLEKSLVTHPYDRDILEALASFHQARGENAAAQQYVKRLQALSASDNSP